MNEYSLIYTISIIVVSLLSLKYFINSHKPKPIILGAFCSILILGLKILFESNVFQFDDKIIGYFIINITIIFSFHAYLRNEDV